jgi:CDP-glucose 4,6-dehydratase
MDQALRLNNSTRRSILESSWNFGPAIESVRPVNDLIKLVTTRWPGGRWHHSADAEAVHEARLLALDPAKAARELGWQPRWTFEQAVNTTVDWYHAVHQGADTVALSLQQIQSFTQS